MGADVRPVLGWGWFVAWMAVGGLYMLSLVSMLTVGIFVLPIAVVATVLLAHRRQAGRGALGLVAGLALPLLYVALLNRNGPGMVCSAIEGGTACTEQMSPWPWVVAGLVFMTLGTCVFWLGRPRVEPLDVSQS